MLQNVKVFLNPFNNWPPADSKPSREALDAIYLSMIPPKSERPSLRVINRKQYSVVAKQEIGLAFRATVSPQKRSGVRSF